MLGEQSADFPADGLFRFARQRASVDIDVASIRNNVRLRTAGNDSDIDRGTTKDWMASATELRGVVGFKHFHDLGHEMHRVPTELRTRAVRGFPTGQQAQPDIPLVRGHHF